MGMKKEKGGIGEGGKGKIFEKRKLEAADSPKETI